MKSSAEFLNHHPEGFPHLTYAEALESIRIDLDFHRRAIVDINRYMCSPHRKSRQAKEKAQADKENHKRAVTRLESRLRSLLFGSAKR